MVKTAGWVANIIDPDQTQQNAAFGQDLHRFHWPVCPNAYGKLGRSLDKVLFQSMHSYFSMKIYVARYSIEAALWGTSNEYQ